MTTGLLASSLGRGRSRTRTAATSGQGAPLLPALDVMFCALRHAAADLACKAGKLGSEDWDALARLAIDLHRVGPRVWQPLKTAAPHLVPSPVADRFETDARRAHIQALVSMAETARVVRGLNRIGIEPCLLKGWALEQDLFGEIGRRVTRDLDLMVTGRELPDAAAALQEMGYSCALTEAFRERQALDSFTRFAHHIVFFRPKCETMIELHVRPFRNQHLLPLSTLETEPRETTAPGGAAHFRVPTWRWNFVYLALHGYVHRWERAKWLVDIPPVLDLLSGADWQWIHQLARRLAIERALGIALVLSRDFLEAEIPEPAKPLLESADGSYRAAACRRELVATEPYSDRPTLRRWLESHAVHMSASPRLAVIGASIETLIVRESDVLPSRLANRHRSLQYLFAALHIPRRLGRRVWRRILGHGV